MKQFFLFTALLVTGCLSAQHQTLLGRSPLNGAFGAPIYEFSVDNGIQGGIGGGGGLVFRNFFLGAYGVASIDGLEELLEAEDIDNLRLAHGGLWLGYTPASYSLIHPYFSARAGWGVLDIEFDDPSQNFDDLDQVFALTPEAGIEMNLTRWFRISGTIGYRYIAGVNDTTPSTVTDNLEGLIGAVTLRFGWFGNHRYSSRKKWRSEWD